MRPNGLSQGKSSSGGKSSSRASPETEVSLVATSASSSSTSSFCHLALACRIPLFAKRKTQAVKDRRELSLGGFQGFLKVIMTPAKVIVTPAKSNPLSHLAPMRTLPPMTPCHSLMTRCRNFVPSCRCGRCWQEISGCDGVEVRRWADGCQRWYYHS